MVKKVSGKKQAKTQGKAKGKPKAAPPKTGKFRPEVKVCPSPVNLFEEAAHLFLETALESVKSRGRFATALSGGSTPQGLFQQLSEEPYRSLVPWAKTLVFWSDERHVPWSAPASNFRVARELLLSKVPVPKDHVFPFTEGNRPLAETAHLYERTLARVFGSKDIPRMDLTLLGMGEDGHTASLFPGMPQLNELDKWVEGYFVDETRGERLTLTFPVLNASRLTVVLLQGGKKAKRVKDVLEGPSNPPHCPVQYLRPTEGRLLFMMDEAAAKLIKQILL